jgi:hypothetical protein
MSANELAFAAQHPKDFVLYRLYNFDDALDATEFLIVEGDPASYFDCTPSTFRLKAPSAPKQVDGGYLSTSSK